MSRSTVPSKRPAEAQEAAWVADEDRFVLKQAKKKAAIRVKGGRAQPVDWLAVTLAILDPERNPLDDEIDQADLDLVGPEAVFDECDDPSLVELEKSIDTYLALESSKSNREYWTMMKTICSDRRETSSRKQATARGISSVASDLDKLLSPKSLEELEKLEKGVKAKLSSNEAADTDYWESLSKSLLAYKAKAKLKSVSQSVFNARSGALRKQQADDAALLKNSLEIGLPMKGGLTTEQLTLLDPEPLLRLPSEDKSIPSMTEAEFALMLESARKRVLTCGYVSGGNRSRGSVTANGSGPPAKRMRLAGDNVLSTSAAFDREVSRGLGENEEVFTQEVEVVTKNRAQWADQYRPRKPKYFNRVSLGYEWNKYNQTHYDQDNPPPRVVQGYRFNVFYPDLVDQTKAPTYRMERENGRKRGQTMAPAGEDDTCVIRFIASAPYEDIAFRVVDKEWDYSAKRERGFRSSFDKGVLQLHFQFKKIYYRK